MELARVRQILAEIENREDRLPDAEEASRIERYKDLGQRIIALSPDRLAFSCKEDNLGIYTQREIYIGIPDSEEGSGDSLMLSVKLEYVAVNARVVFPDADIDRLVEIKATWQDKKHNSIYEQLCYRDLHKIPEDTEVAFSRLEQTLAAIAPYTGDDGLLDAAYIL